MVVYFSDGLQQDGSPDGFDSESKHIIDADISEDIRRLLTELVSGVVESADGGTDGTRKSSKRRAADDVPLSSCEPRHKRRRPFCGVSRRTSFNPVAEHHLWCPHVCDVADDGSDDAGCKPWLRLLRQLVPDAEAALSRIQTSPAPEGIDRIRKLFRAWTSTT